MQDITTIPKALQKIPLSKPKILSDISRETITVGKAPPKLFKNFARENNIQNGFYKLENNEFKPIEKNTKTDNQGLYYVQVAVHGLGDKYKHMEILNEEDKSEFIKNQSINSLNEPKLFVCTNPHGDSTIKISDITKRVVYIEFYEKEQKI